MQLGFSSGKFLEGKHAEWFCPTNAACSWKTASDLNLTSLFFTTPTKHMCAVILSVQWEDERKIICRRSPHGADTKNLRNAFRYFPSPLGENTNFVGSHDPSRSYISRIPHNVSTKNLPLWLTTSAYRSLLPWGMFEANGLLLPL
jgi:hypothetical protein